MTVAIDGTVMVLGDVEHLSDKFSKRDIIVQIDESSQYPNLCKVQFSNANADKLSGISVGDRVSITADIRSSKLFFNEKLQRDDCFTKFNGWRIDILQRAPRTQNAPQSNPNPQGAANPTSAPQNTSAQQQAANFDDIPF